MAYLIITTNLSLPYITPNPFKGTLYVPFKGALHIPFKGALYAMGEPPVDPGSRLDQAQDRGHEVHGDLRCFSVCAQSFQKKFIREYGLSNKPLIEVLNMV